MKKILLTLNFVIIFLFLQSTTAQIKYEFTDFGYPEESVIWGSKSQSTFFISVGEDSLFSKGSQLNLNFKTSQVLNQKKSFVTIAINEIPLATKSPSRDGHTVNFIIPLKQSDVNSGFIRIDVYSDLVINEDLCEVYDKGAYWLRRLSTSRIILNLKKSADEKIKTISDFMNEANHIYISDNPSLNSIKYSAYIKFYLKNELGKSLEVSKIPERLDSIEPGSILLGEINELNPILGLDYALDELNQGNGLVRLHNLNSKDSLISDSKGSTVLLVTAKDSEGLEKAAQSLLDKDIFKSAFTTSYTVNQGLDLHGVTTKAVRKISLRDLGVNDEMIEGIGKMQKTITFPSAIFQSGLSQLNLNLKFIYRPLQENEEVYVNIYMDNMLKSSHSLNDSGSFEKIINFNDFEFRQEKNLKVEFYYLPEGGNCIIKPAAFYAQLDLEASYFEATAFNKNEELNFGNFTRNLFENKATIYWDVPFNIKQIDLLSQLVEVHNPGLNLTKHYNFPPIFPLDSLEKNIHNTKGIIITSQAESLKKLGELNPYFDFYINQYQFKKEDYSKYFNITFDDKIGVNQLFERKDKDFMFIYAPEGDPGILEQLTSGFLTSDLSNRGNLILANKDDSYSFSLNNQELLSKKEVETNFDMFWKNYGIVIIFGLIILMIVLLIYIFQKSQDSKNSIIENK